MPLSPLSTDEREDFCRLSKTYTNEHLSALLGFPEGEVLPFYENPFVAMGLARWVGMPSSYITGVLTAEPALAKAEQAMVIFYFALMQIERLVKEDKLQRITAHAEKNCAVLRQLVDILPPPKLN